MLLIAACVLARLLAADFPSGEINPAAAGMDAQRIARIPGRMQEFVKAGKAAGIVTLVARHGHIALLNAVGYQDLETRTPMRTNTLFRLMSMTKPMTGTAVMMLVDDGRISVIDPVEKWLPEFKGPQVKVKCAQASTGPECLAKPAHAITIADVLSHVSGIQEPPKGSRTLAEFAAAAAKLPLEFEPGTMWRYRTAGTNVAGRIVEVVSGEPYERFMAERLFSPLGMRDTTFFPRAEDAGRIATVYTAQNGALKRAEMALPKPS